FFSSRRRHTRSTRDWSSDVCSSDLDLLRLRDWLKDHDCTCVAMESTGVFWKPIYNLLEEHFQVLVVNAQHIKAVPGRKTDIKDRSEERRVGKGCRDGKRE